MAWRRGFSPVSGAVRPVRQTEGILKPRTPHHSLNTPPNSIMSIPSVAAHTRPYPVAVRPLDGYPSLAEDIASDPDRTTLVFRRFDKLAVRNLLYLQSELVELEARQVCT
jgi:hypothetical protein